MGYEVDLIRGGADVSAKDADAICLRWKVNSGGNDSYDVGVMDGGFETHCEANCW